MPSLPAGVPWIPACAGMTRQVHVALMPPSAELTHKLVGVQL